MDTDRFGGFVDPPPLYKEFNIVGFRLEVQKNFIIEIKPAVENDVNGPDNDATGFDILNK